MNRINDELKYKKKEQKEGKGLKPIETSNYKVY